MLDETNITKKDGDGDKSDKSDKKLSLHEDIKLHEILGVEIPSKPPTRTVVMVGCLVIAGFIGGFSAWSYLAPIESAAIAQGQVVVSGNRRTIQHLEGGIIKKINVKDGSLVNKGEILVQLDDKRSKTELALTKHDSYQLMAIEARLIAERDNRSNIDFPRRLIVGSAQLPSLHRIMLSQEAILHTNNASFGGNIKILRKQIVQLKEQIKGVEAQLTANDRQYSLIKGEVRILKGLAAKKLIEQEKLLQLQREEARLMGARGDNIARIAVLKHKISETETKIISDYDSRQKEILAELRKTQQKLTDVLKKEVVAQDIFNRTLIRSPQKGQIVGLNVHTVGGVIKSGEPIMEIVPDENPIIDARVSPLDIDVVHKGMIAKVQLSAYKTRVAPTLLGEVESVSADALQDPQTGQLYYSAKIYLSPEQLEKVGSDQPLYPGMPVQAMIIVNKRSFWQYIITPITDSFRRSFREQ